jgi:DNA-binding NarL/FixJ family response regulator
MYSTTCHPEEISEYMRLGARKVLVKPNSLSKIETLVKSVLFEQFSQDTNIVRVTG